MGKSIAVDKTSYQKIVRNAARCRHCGDLLESRNRLDYQGCTCGKVFVAGGRNCIRRGFDDVDDYDELSEYADADTDDPDGAFYWDSEEDYRDWCDNGQPCETP